MNETVVLAYSGGLDTSVAVKWIQNKYKSDVVTVTVDVGQQDDLKSIARKAEKLGALKHYSLDAREEFAERYIALSIKANALYEDKYPLGTALARPLIARKLVEIAEKEGATAVAHGCTGKGNDQVRFDVTIKALNPSLRIIAPIREWKLSREEEIEYAKRYGVPIPVTKDKPYSIDQNLWSRSIECGILEDPSQEPPEDVFEWTTSPEKAPDQPQYVQLDFQKGLPTSINGKSMKPVALIQTLNELAGKHAVGRVDHLEDRLVGIKSREIYECPAASVILEAHKDIEKAVLTRHELSFKTYVDEQWAWLVYSGLWMDPLRQDLDAFIEATQRRVSGQVRLKLYKGGVRVVGRSSPSSLYMPSLSTYGIETSYDQSWSNGFIEIWGLPTRVASAIAKKDEEST